MVKKKNNELPPYEEALRSLLNCSDGEEYETRLLEQYRARYFYFSRQTDRIQGKSRVKIVSILKKLGMGDDATQDQFIFEVCKIVVRYEYDRFAWNYNIPKDEIKEELDILIKALGRLKNINNSTWDFLGRSMHTENNKACKKGQMNDQEEQNQSKNWRIVLNIFSSGNLQELVDLSERALKYLDQQESQEFYDIDAGEYRTIKSSYIPLYKERIAGASSSPNADIFIEKMMIDLLYLWKTSFKAGWIEKSVRNDQNDPEYIRFITIVYSIIGFKKAEKTIKKHVSTSVKGLQR